MGFCWEHYLLITLLGTFNLEKLIVTQLVKKLPTFNHLLPYLQDHTNPCPEPDEPSPHLPTISPRFILISSHLHLCLQSGLFSSGFPTNILYAFLNSPIRATCPAHLILLDLITLIISGEAYKL